MASTLLLRQVNVLEGPEQPACQRDVWIRGGELVAWDAGPRGRWWKTCRNWMAAAGGWPPPWSIPTVFWKTPGWDVPKPWRVSPGPL